MKKIRLFTFGLLVLAIFSQTNSYAQFCDGFIGTGNIGGNCTTVGATPDCANNGWLTHSGTVGTIDIVLGSLNYTGLPASTGNKVYIIGDAALTRDVNAAINPTITTVGYYSALINVIDNTNLGTTVPNYFMHFAATAGNSGVTEFPARLGIKSVNAGANFRFSILNMSGGTYTDCATDLTFGTTYLVVVKFNIAANTASLWVNPASLGGTEPTADAINSSSTTAPTGTLSSICIRNGWDSGNSAGAPKAEIDEIRVNTTWAGVTSTGINEIKDVKSFQVSPNPSNGFVNILFTPKTSYNVSVYNTLGAIVYNQTNINDNNVALNLSKLNKGIYFVQIKDNNSSAVAAKKIVIQ